MTILFCCDLYLSIALRKVKLQQVTIRKVFNHQTNNNNNFPSVWNYKDIKICTINKVTRNFLIRPEIRENVTNVILQLQSAKTETIGASSPADLCLKIS